VIIAEHRAELGERQVARTPALSRSAAVDGVARTSRRSPRFASSSPSTGNATGAPGASVRACANTPALVETSSLSLPSRAGQ
jgi:hypothetical protein